MISTSGGTSKRTTRSTTIKQEPSAGRKPIPRLIREIRKPECIDFGKDRETQWPEYFFCSNCKLFEDELVTRPKLDRLSCSKKYLCQANHKSFDHPTVKRKEWCRSVENIIMETGDDKNSTFSKGKIGRPKKKAKIGIASYLDQLFMEKETMMLNAGKVKAKNQYLLD